MIPSCKVKPVAPVDVGELMRFCRANLSSYKLPREIRVVAQSDFPRSTSGKVQRKLVERWLDVE